ncbi:MAG TPA: purine-nucleoside phosphorylase [Xanthobacteraceae bacterium]|jgi:purine-nucleoside phosphorylase|nr:purine-nucleoside phosphorylase [Xanthobacteraceae bacterium]
MRDESKQSAALIRAQIGAAPVDVGLVVGGNLAAIAEHITSPVSFRYADLPGFALPRVGGDAAECVIGTLGSARIALFKGRAYYHEAGDPGPMRVPLETLKLLGAGAVVLTGAAGSVRRELAPGGLTAIRDHINLTGINPLVGIDAPDRAVDLTTAYDPHLRERFAKAASEGGRKSHEATLMWFPGPSFETPAEIQAARTLGADMVGMSIVPDTLIARHIGLRVLALATVTNYAAGLSAEMPSREHAMRVSTAAAATLIRVLLKLFELWVLDARAR